MSRKAMVNAVLFLSGGMLAYLSLPMDTIASIVVCVIAGATLGIAIAKLMAGE